MSINIFTCWSSHLALVNNDCCLIEDFGNDDFELTLLQFKSINLSIFKLKDLITYSYLLK